MVTCRDLLKLEVFKNIPVVAGHDGLDRVVSWPYPKHTKVITPWVKGGEFVMVSGYELGVNEDELLHLIDEAVVNQLSGLLVEGGVNFKSLSDRILEKADSAQIPLFFAPRVVSFLDISREVSSLILELQLANKYTASLLEQVLAIDPSNVKDLQFLFERHQIPFDCSYQVVCLAMTKKAGAEGEMLPVKDSDAIRAINELREPCDTALKRLGLRVVAMTSFDHVTYLIYGKEEGQFHGILNALNDIRSYFSNTHTDYGAVMAASEVAHGPSNIAGAFNQAGFVRSLMLKGVLAGNFNSFSDLGSYQFLFYVQDKTFLLRFRDSYLKALCDSEQGKMPYLIETLRVYLSFGGNVLNTAKALYIHRNTLQHRLDRIEAITGKRLDDADERQNFQNALMILNIYPF